MNTPQLANDTVAKVGGGPAGMEAALICAQRGHQVTLFEKRALGGLVREASVPPFKADLRRLLEYYPIQLKKNGVAVIYEEASVETLKGFDAVIVATGAVKASLNVPGADGEQVHNAIDALESWPEMGEKVTVIGGGSVGVETAIVAAGKGKKVTVIEMQDHLMNGEDEAIAGLYLGMLAQNQIEVLLCHSLKSIEKDKVTVADGNGVVKEIPSDTVLMSVGLKPDLSLYDELAEAGCSDIYFAGDCEAPKKIFDAIHAGFTCGCQV
ncbi:MAG: FAD-dependent oxidoreductase [Enterocloster sp.]